MRFQEVCAAAFAHALPSEVVRSADLEEELAPLYSRLGLSAGRLELMTGIRERRFWPRGTRPSHVATQAGERALLSSGIDRQRIGCLIHSSVCRDFLEPATASFVHRSLELRDACTVFDLSNACLGFANAMTIAASMIERGEIEAGLVVAGEDGRALVESTVRALLAGPHVGRSELKAAFASLTIGSGAAAAVLCHRSLSNDPEHGRFIGGAARADTRYHDLCHGSVPPSGGGPLMQTDSEGLLHAGSELAAQTFQDFVTELGWTREKIDRITTHQVSVAHRRTVLAALAIDPKIDFPTVETLGNIGSVSLPLSFSMACEQGFIRRGHRVAMLGIGSGLHCLMLGVHW